MLRIKLYTALVILLIGCVGQPISPLSPVPDQKLTDNITHSATEKEVTLSVTLQHVPQVMEQSPVGSLEASKKNQLLIMTQPFITAQAKPLDPSSFSPSVENTTEKKMTPPPELTTEIPQALSKKTIMSNPEQSQSRNPLGSPKTPSHINKNDLSTPAPTVDLSTQKLTERRQDNEKETERDIMEEALVLLNESHAYWINGDLEDALEMLDQAYSLLLDTNGDPDIARQKDDLRLMISKRILSIYNSIQTTAKGIRSEIPVITNANVEKEIHQFQTVERDFFISSIQRSAMFRPIILRELQKAGLPEELSWLPLVESGFKISALSTARALGLWQFIPSTGYKYGLNRDEWVDERMDIEKSTRAAIDYLKELHSMFGDWLTVLAAYNCGEGRVMRTIAAQHINYLDRFWDLYHQLPYETARYVPRFLATLLIIRDPQKYGLDLGRETEKMTSLSYEVAEVNKCMRLQDIAQKLETSEEILNILNAELRHKITPDRIYNLKVPLDMSEKLLGTVDEIQQAEIPRASFLAKRGAVIRHKVRRGETIASIAKKYNTSIRAITAYNHLSKKSRLMIGRRLNIPLQISRGTVSFGMTERQKDIHRYAIRKGDTLASLARRFQTTIAEIRKSNHMDNDLLKIGQVLLIKKDDDNEGVQQRKKVSSRKSSEKVGMHSASYKNANTTKVKKYTVKKGDSLNDIARANNMSLNQLVQLNSLARKDNIHPGQIILIQ